MVVISIIMAPGMNSKPMNKRQANQVLDLLPIGELVNTQHNVRGMVWAYNNSLLLVEDFDYDGLGFGVYLQVATEGETIQEWVNNRRTIGYPNPEDKGTPLEQPFGADPEKVDWLVLRMPQDINVVDIKWMTVWCDQFGISFGDVQFPDFVYS